MECLDNERILEYIEGDLNHVENSMARDHIIVCDQCRKEYESFKKIEDKLLEPIFLTPPSIIEKNVLRMLFPRVPAYSSIFALIAASMILVVTWIYVYFDFANNSLIQAFQLTSHNTSNWIGSIVKVISSIFSAVYAVFRVINSLVEIVFNINVGVEIIGLATLAIFSAVLYLIARMVMKKMKGAEA